ncbi:MAG: FGGY-family carbohydrate kinase [Azospirillaceae bacterium]|nr:FGGY-family carbohydrate kinase [Azospirillaceae bacterium]
MTDYAIGVDVGTGSVRAALFDMAGTRFALADAPIRLNRPRPLYAEQSSADIWAGVCATVRSIMRQSGVHPSDVRAIGFDATCSLVALDDHGAPTSVSPGDEDQWNVVVWMDHRAIDEALAINQGNHEVLKYVGGAISPEMEIPKILWLKNHRPDQYQRVAHFFDLADFLTFRATGSMTRSSCTTSCKWTYLNHEKRWSPSFFDSLGLFELLQGERIGSQIKDPGEAIGTLSVQAAAELGLPQSVVVGAGLIDAHAGGLGVLGDAPEETLAVIAGTSACHMASNRSLNFVPGIWGPYYGAMIPGYWLAEGGQSAAGALVDFVIRDSAAYPRLQDEMRRQDVSAYTCLNELIAQIETLVRFPTADFHLLGYYLGNRSPLADPTLTGSICGLKLDDSLESLAIRYLAALQSVAYGTRHIIETMNSHGFAIRRVRLCGGGAKNPLWVREFADITGMPIEIISESEAMLLGSAMLGATACGHFKSLPLAMIGMSGDASVTIPRENTATFHDSKYAIFREMANDQIKYRTLRQAS